MKGRLASGRRIPLTPPLESRVTVRIAGGLGNQLFQYAAARALAERNRAELVIDNISGFPRDYYKRAFSLSHFNISGSYIEIKHTYISNWRRLVRRCVQMWSSYQPLPHRYYISEKNPTVVDNDILSLRVNRPVYLDGYWQHEEYFRDISGTLKDRELTLCTKHDENNRRLAERITTTNAVCLHVRRLHTVPNSPNAKPPAEGSVDQLPVLYYQAAIESICKVVNNPHFYIFSDYPDWAKENIQIKGPATYVTHNTADKDYEDFWLMTLCKHFIIANSTFSWWAAWLGSDKSKIVFAPKNVIGLRLQSVPATWTLL